MAASAKPQSAPWSSDTCLPAARDLHDEPADRSSGLRVLLIEHDRKLRDGCVSLLRADGHVVTACERAEGLTHAVRCSSFDVIVLDVDGEAPSGKEVLARATAACPDAIVIVTSARPTVQSSVHALRLGAWEYLPKPFAASHLQLLVGRAARTTQRRREQFAADDGDAPGQASHSSRMTLLGVSPSFQRAIALARKVAATDASVMLVGESGTGKEMIAQFVHLHSRRERQPFVIINGAAMPEQLLESEMFGHRRGSFTGADRDKRGLLEMAHQGTFFLDEIIDMPLTLQAKLLRVVQDGVVRRVGSETTDATVDVRFISATNRDPREAIASRQLREDLFYRLNVFQIVLPPLRERPEDIPILAQHFLERSWRRHHASARMPALSAGALERLQEHRWRGNVRELQNVIEHLTVLAPPGGSIRADDVVIEGRSPSVTEQVRSMPLADGYHAAREHVIARFEREYMTQLVARASGNMARAARLAKVDRTTLYRLIARSGISQHREELPPP